MVLKSKFFRGILIVICVLALIAIRFFEDQLFYDPFLNYFKTDYTQKPLPEIETFRYLLNLAYRFSINGLLSLVVLALLFRDQKIVQFSGIMLLILFVLLTITLLLVLNFIEHPHKMSVFYLRRFLIQPLFLLLFIPGFYFHQKTKIDS